MSDLIVEKKINIVASFGADDWRLDLDHEHAEDAAIRLNERLEFLVNSGFEHAKVYSRMAQYMAELSEFGADSYSSKDFLSQTLVRIYG